MSADLHIHVRTDELLDKDLEIIYSSHLGHPYCKWGDPYSSEERDAAYERIYKTPTIWIGEVSWLKAMIFDDEENYVPNTVGQISELFDDYEFAVIDEKFIEDVDRSLKLPNQTNYNINTSDKVIPFLREHLGKRVFKISW